MFLREYVEQTRHNRISKKGKAHEYVRTCSYAIFRCDNCDKEFSRPRGKMNPKRLSNNYFHVCGQCNAKQFAQKRGVEKRKVWNLKASSTLPISKL